jgi:hypothetical protein
MRDDFSPKVVENLAKRVGHFCSRPGCNQPTTGPQANPEKVINVGAAAHITAASPNGPRYDPGLTPAQRRSIENGIWLCQTCAKLVDNDEIRYPTSLLREWKGLAESRAIRAIEEGARPSRTPDQEAGDRLKAELTHRGLFDVNSADFAKTKFSKNLILVNSRGEQIPVPTAAVSFAFIPASLVTEHDLQRFTEWINPNERRYRPVHMLQFVPGFFHEDFCRAKVWHDGNQTRFIGGTPRYFTYLAADFRAGYFEYGFCPALELHNNLPTVYYSFVLAHFFSFLRFVKDFGTAFGHHTWATSIGLAIRGTRQTILHVPLSRFARAFARDSNFPDSDGLLWCRTATLDTDWTADSATMQVARELLDHWQFSRPMGMLLPEFDGEMYSGSFFSGRGVIRGVHGIEFLPDRLVEKTADSLKLTSPATFQIP